MLMLMIISDLPVCSIYIVAKVNERTKGVLRECFCYCSYFVELSCECFLIYDDPQILVTLVTGSLQPLHGSTLEECGEQDQCPGSVSCAQCTVHSCTFAHLHSCTVAQLHSCTVHSAQCTFAFQCTVARSSHPTKTTRAHSTGTCTPTSLTSHDSGGAQETCSMHVRDCVLHTKGLCWPHWCLLHVDVRLVMSFKGRTISHINPYIWALPK